MIHRLRLLVLASLALAVATPGVRADPDAPFLWEVRGAHTHHWLLGSVHLLPQAAQTWPAGIADAYDEAEGLVFESDLGELESPATAVALLSAGRGDKGGLRRVLDAPTYARLQRQLAGIGLRRDFCDDYKPWFCAVALELAEYQKAGFRPEYGLDRQLYAAAKTDAKPVHGLETVGQGLAVFTEMTPSLAKQLLATELADDGNGIDSPAAMFRAWQQDDAEAVGTVVEQLKRASAPVYARLLADRNRAWLPRLKPWLDGVRPQLIVVGAAHLVGPDGLIERLRAAGYRVVPKLDSHDREVALRDFDAGGAARAAAGGTHAHR